MYVVAALRRLWGCTSRYTNAAESTASPTWNSPLQLIHLITSLGREYTTCLISLWAETTGYSIASPPSVHITRLSRLAHPPIQGSLVHNPPSPSPPESSTVGHRNEALTQDVRRERRQHRTRSRGVPLRVVHLGRSTCHAKSGRGD